jgi:hypothetical protein
MTGDPLEQSTEAIRRRLAAVSAATDDPVTLAVGYARVAADDAAEGWASLADDLETAARFDRRYRRAARKARDLARISAALQRDLTGIDRP